MGRGFSCLHLARYMEVWMEDLSGAACVGQDPGLWDPDTHLHIYLKGTNSCWICDDARDICMECPVISGCFEQARRLRESHTIRAGMAWTNGRPRDLKKRRT